jgi:hypothetical protein
MLFASAYEQDLRECFRRIHVWAKLPPTFKTLEQIVSSRNQVKAVTDCESFCTAAIPSRSPPGNFAGPRRSARTASAGEDYRRTALHFAESLAKDKPNRGKIAHTAVSEKCAK